MVTLFTESTRRTTSPTSWPTALASAPTPTTATPSKPEELQNHKKIIIEKNAHSNQISFCNKLKQDSYSVYKTFVQKRCKYNMYWPKNTILFIIRLCFTLYILYVTCFFVIWYVSFYNSFFTCSCLIMILKQSWFNLKSVNQKVK